jgi:hypothetical protein
MGLALTAERLSVGIKTAQGPYEVGLGDAQTPVLPGAERRRIRCLLGAEAAVAATVVGWTESTTPGLRHRAKTRRATRHHNAHCTPPPAFETDAVGWGVWLAPVQKGTDDLEELLFVDRTAAQFKIHTYMVRNRRGCV